MNAKPKTQVSHVVSERVSERGCVSAYFMNMHICTMYIIPKSIARSALKYTMLSDDVDDSLPYYSKTNTHTRAILCIIVMYF